MSAETIRRAAALMRERTEAVANSLHGAYDWTGIGTGYREPIKQHIASWDPVTALAVADWLDCSADHEELLPGSQGYAMAVARAYLGGPA